MRIGVLVPLAAQQLAAGFEVGYEVGVAVLDEAPFVRADPLVVGAVEADRVDNREPGLLAEAVIVFAESDGGVDEARAVLVGYEIGGQYGVAALAPVGGGDEIERRLVAGALQIGAWEAVQNLCLLAEHAPDERLGNNHHRVVAGNLRADVRQLRINCDGSVGDQSPWRRCPDDQLVAGLQRSLCFDQWEADEDAGVDHILVALGDLMRGERGATARAVRDNLVALVKHLLVPDLLQRPPNRLDVAGVERAVGVIKIDPKADPLGQPIPLVEEGKDRVAALLVELGDAELFDLSLR